MGYKILEIEKGWKLLFSLDNLIVFFDNKKISIPANDVSFILFNNITTNISVKTIVEITNRNILTVFCNDKHLPTSYLLPISGHYDSLKILQNQCNWTNQWKGEVWQTIIKLKIFSQIKCLEYCNKKIIGNETNLINMIQVGDQSNMEASFSAKYFKSLFGASFERLNFKDRNRMSQYSEYINFVNSYLNYGYTILMAMFARSIVKNGYDTRISIFHCSFSNHTALASDLMEPFRSIIDASVFNIIREIKNDILTLDSTVKKRIIDLALKDIVYNNERITIFNAVDKYVNDVLKRKDVKIEYLYGNY